MLAAEEPVAKLVVYRRAAETLLGKIGGDPLFELGGRQAVVGAAVDGSAIAGEGCGQIGKLGGTLLTSGEGRASAFATPFASSGTCHPSSGATTGTIGSSNSCANSKSRSSCAGTAMIAPVP